MGVSDKLLTRSCERFPYIDHMHHIAPGHTHMRDLISYQISTLIGNTSIPVSTSEQTHVLT